MSQLSEKKVKKFLNDAKKASRNSEFHQHRLGAVLIYKGTPLASGCNIKKTSPVQKHFNRLRTNYDVDADYANNNSLHAEMSCILKTRYLDIDFSKTSLFVYREHKNGNKAMARPCRACRAMIKKMGIKDVYYTTEDGYCYERME